VAHDVGQTLARDAKLCSGLARRLLLSGHGTDAAGVKRVGIGTPAAGRVRSLRRQVTR
jgi:hypothetical protein